MSEPRIAIELANDLVIDQTLGDTQLRERVHDAMKVVVVLAGTELTKETTLQGLDYMGHLRGAWMSNSGVDVTPGGVLGWIDPTPIAPYAWTVIYGRKPGKMPPPIALLPWVWKKLGVQGMAARGVAWNIARKIGKRGTKPHPIIENVEKNHKAEWADIIQAALCGG